MFQIRKAERTQSKLRVWMSWPSWSWKTYSSLKLAYWICWNWQKICLIDTENWSGDMYSNLWEYNIITLVAPFSPERYIEAIKSCEEAGMEVIIIDSITHEWNGKGWCLEINELLAKTKYKGNSWSAWNETTPRHQKFIDKIIQSNCHIITSVRNKTDTVITDDGNWRKQIKKVWLKEETREWFEYELTINFTIDRDSHLALAGKDRTWLFIERDPFLIDEKIWGEIREWNLLGKEWKSYAEIVEDEKLKEAQNKKTNLPTETIPPVAPAITTPVQTERYLQFQASFDTASSVDELKKIYERLKNHIWTDKKYMVQAQVDSLLIVLNKKKAELETKKEVETPTLPPITPTEAVNSAWATVGEVVQTWEEIAKATDVKVEGEKPEQVKEGLSFEEVEKIFDN